MHAPWRIELLGWLRATQGDRVVSRFRSRKIRDLLAFLAYRRDRPHPRETLIELLWPECDPAAGRQRLRQALHLLRHQLEPPGVPPGAVILADHTTVQLNPAACTSDVAELEATLQRAARAGSDPERTRHLIAAVELYRGELLPGCFEDWVLQERQRLAEAHLQALDQLTTLLEQAGDLPGALRSARRAVAADPLREETHHALIRLLRAAAQPEAALRQYHELERLLVRDLGAAPAPATRALAAAIQPGAAASAPAARATTVSTPGPPGACGASPPQPVSPARPSGPDPTPASPLLSAREGHLPPPLTRFFGREVEIARLCELFLGEGTAATGGGIADSRSPIDSDPIQNPKSKIAWSP